MPSPLSVIVYGIENMLSSYYAFAPVSSAAPFLINDESLAVLAKEKNLDSEGFSPARGSVLLVDDGNEDGMFIGIHIADQIASALESRDPLHALDAANLDGFCLLIEEISHFHLILNRMVDGKNVSRLELEWQAEIDKLLIASMTLKAQYGSAHRLHLARTLFDDALITSEKKELYETATRYAAKFWYGVAKSNGWNEQSIRSFLRENYHLSWDDKRSNLNALRSA